MLFTDLLKRQETGSPIRIGMSGSGWMARGFLNQLKYVPGMNAPVVADPEAEKARHALIDTGADPGDIIETCSAGRAEDAVRAGKWVATGDVALPAQVESVDIVTDVTPSPSRGAEAAYSGIKYGKDVVLVNIETDATVGRLLHTLARQNGVLYCVATGDEPGCLMELWDFANTLGYRPIAIGKGKNNPLNPDATPDSVVHKARQSGKDPFQIASYVDGTKTMFEMTCAANATGCTPIRRGMVGPRADIDTVSRVFSLEQDGGLVKYPPAVDFVQGESMAGGVFITVKVEDEQVQADLEYLKAGKGQYYTFFRPFHLWFLEAPVSFARAGLYRKPALVPIDHPPAEAVTAAKKDLKPGDILDSFGGYTFYGLIDHTRAARSFGALPAGLAPGAKMTGEVKKGEIIKWEDVRVDETSTLVRLCRQQLSM